MEYIFALPFDEWRDEKYVILTCLCFSSPHVNVIQLTLRTDRLNGILYFHLAIAHPILIFVIYCDFSFRLADGSSVVWERNDVVVEQHREALPCFDDVYEEFRADDGYAGDVDVSVNDGLLWDDVSFPYSL